MAGTSRSTGRGAHQISDQYGADVARVDPMLATAIGVPGHDDQLTDYSPDGYQARYELLNDAMREMAVVEPADEAERVAKAVFLDRLSSVKDLHEAGEFPDFNVVDSPVQNTRMLFDLMPTDTPEDWATIAARLAKVPESMASLRAGLAHAAEQGRVPALRQVTKVAEQCDTWSGATGGPSFFA